MRRSCAATLLREAVIHQDAASNRDVERRRAVLGDRQLHVPMARLHYGRRQPVILAAQDVDCVWRMLERLQRFATHFNGDVHSPNGAGLCETIPIFVAHERQPTPRFDSVR